jgi:tRNA(fMet)-specific endonuclease VapC
MIYLLDTDIFVMMLRGIKNPKKIAEHRRAVRIATRCRDEQKVGNAVVISAITVSELEYGARNSGEYDHEILAVNKMLKPFKVLDFDGVECPIHYGAIRETLTRQGMPIGPMDMLIAAHARAIDATLVTNNSSDFRRIAGLKLDNWH